MSNSRQILRRLRCKLVQFRGKQTECRRCPTGCLVRALGASSACELDAVLGLCRYVGGN
jgi:hypothetical protein